LELEQKSLVERAADYYRGERISNALLFVVGTGALLWTLFLFLWRQGHLSTGLFYSTLPFALFFIISGIYRFIRSLDRFKNITDDHTGPQYLSGEEKEHLNGRKQRFLKKRKIDTIGVILGFMMIFGGVFLHLNHLFIGTAVSITFASFVLLVFDLFGQFRTEEFLHHLNK
jgi:hypothetical protein